MKKRTIVERPGWDRIDAVRDGHIYEIKSTYILQPGPASLTDGVRQLHAIIERYTEACAAC
jgi:iron complex transport system substrate-binding protein